MFWVYYYGPTIALLIGALMIAFFRVRKSAGLRLVGEDWLHWVLLAVAIVGTVLAFSFPGPAIIRHCLDRRHPDFALQVNIVRVGCAIAGLMMVALLHWKMYRATMNAPKDRIKL